MFDFKRCALPNAVQCIVLFLFSLSIVNAAPVSQVKSRAASSYWVADIARNGTVAYGDSSFQIFRNVKDFGAVGDGVTDDTAAINSAISSGNRCGLGCDSTTVTPAIVYFPPGTYLVSTPIIQYYYTQFIGDALDLPVLKASASFTGMAVIDADPYTDTGANWYTNQNNFYRQIRNFVIDLTAMPATSGAGIHWQVAQATSLQNIRFEMIQGGDNNAQEGIFMDNGSGGFMTDLVFNGGNYGAFLGSQQFTTRNLTFNNCNTAIYMNWNWVWNLKSITINNCKVGVDMANGVSNQTVGSVLIQDSTFVNTPVGVNTSYSDDSIPNTGGTLILDNVDFTGSTTAVQYADGTQYLAGGSVVSSYIQGRSYTNSTGTRTKGEVTAPTKPTGLLDANGAIFERSKPQYTDYPASSFVSIKAAGAVGDGVTDDTAAIQAALDALTDDQILYFDHGAYVITDTIKIPGTKNVKMTGEIWPLLMAQGTSFADQTSPKPVIQVGEAGDVGSFEMSDFILSTLGPAPGAIMMEWNMAAASQGSAGLWDVHWRIGGADGTQLQSDTCVKNPNATHGADSDCIGSFLLFHATSTASLYVENCWFWVADHELDLSDHSQIDIYNGRGLLIESTGPVWLYGTASEHNVMYNYQLTNAENVYMSVIQTETAYYQSNPDATVPFTAQTAYSDPDFSTYTGTRARKTWGLRVVDSCDVLVYGTGMYSFFENYDESCVTSNDCQLAMASVEGSANNVVLFGLTTKAAVNMLQYGDQVVLDSDNRDVFGATVAKWVP